MTQGNDAPEREVWDFAVFVRHYNEIARERGGWEFDLAGPSADKLRAWYEATTLWSSLRDFAGVRYQLDQEVN